jgi:hypothetical protein
MGTQTKYPEPLWAFLPAALLLLAMGHMPWGYHQFVRIVVCGSSLMILSKSFRERQMLSLWGYTFILMALLFNPIVPFQFMTGIRFYVNALAAMNFIAYAARPNAISKAPVVAADAAPQA